MKKIFFVIILFSIKLAYSQNYNSEVIYTISQNKSFVNSLLDQKKSLTSAMIDGLSENLENIKLILNSINDESHYTLESAPMINSAGSELMQDFARNIAYTGDYFRKSNSKGVFYVPKSAIDVEIIVFYEDLKWKLLNEEKAIGDYICYKAEGEVLIKNSKGSFPRKVIAWYSPQIPVQHGPDRYGGLPGLILQVDDGELVYTAISIKFHKRKMSIPFRTLEKESSTILTEHEYQDLLIKKLGGLREVLSN